MPLVEGNHSEDLYDIHMGFGAMLLSLTSTVLQQSLRLDSDLACLDYQCNLFPPHLASSRIKETASQF